MYPNAPNYPSLWAEAASRACNALNCTATTANPGDKSPYDMWYGSLPPRGAVWPFLKPAVCRVKRNNNSQPKAQDCYYVGPGVNHPRDCMRVLTANRSILTTRNVTWRQVPLSPPVPSKQLPPIAEEGESTAREREHGEGTTSRGGGTVEVDLDGESDLDVTEVRHVLPAIRKTQTAGARAGAKGIAEGAYPASSVSSRRAHNGISSSSSSSNTDNGEKKAAAAPAAGTFQHSRGEKGTDRGGTARYPHSKAGVNGPSRSNTK